MNGWLPAACCFLALGAASGCTRISVAPNCPTQLDVGETHDFEANERTPGAIATYRWEVSPDAAGTFDDEEDKDTTFEAEQNGMAVIRLTASDGLFQVIAECRVQIGSSGPPVDLSTEARSPTVGSAVTLTCESSGSPVATTLVIDQLDGPPVTLASTSPGVSTFTPQAAGQYTFRCVGSDDSGESGEPANLTVTVTGTRPPRG